MSLIRVAKFGGTSVADHQAMLRCANIIKNDPYTRVTLVSASAGVTNLLVTLAQGQLSASERSDAIAQIKIIQYAIIDQLLNPETVLEAINSLLSELTELAERQAIDIDSARTDEILSFGELMSSTLFTQVLVELGVKVTWFDIRRVMKTNSLYSKAVVDCEALKQCCNQLMAPKLDDTVFVSQGFIGQDGLGKTTTLGRGGSDYSAALLAEALDAQEVAIWTDVVGIYTTDPRITSRARPIAEISFGEAAEMATFGAKVLHPATLIPAMRKNIPVFVGSSREPESGGTQIRQTVASKPTYRSIALRRSQSLVTVKSPAMLHASGFLARVFSILAKHELSVDLITTSEISVAMTFDTPLGSTQSGITDNVIKELQQLCEVTVEHGLALVAVIGNNLHASQGFGNSVFDALNDVTIRMICHGASANNLCFMVPEENANSVVSTLHDTLFA